MLVTSGKGGVGKSTVSFYTGLTLALRGRKVLIIELDTGLRSLDVIAGISEQTVYHLGDVTAGRVKPSEAIVSSPLCKNLQLLCAPLLPGGPHRAPPAGLALPGAGPVLRLHLFGRARRHRLRLQGGLYRRPLGADRRHPRPHFRAGRGCGLRPAGRGGHHPPPPHHQPGGRQGRGAGAPSPTWTRSSTPWGPGCWGCCPRAPPCTWRPCPAAPCRKGKPPPPLQTSPGGWRGSRFPWQYSRE